MGSFDYPQPPDRATTAALLEKMLDNIAGRGLTEKHIDCKRSKALDFKVSEYIGILLVRGSYVRALMRLRLHMRACAYAGQRPSDLMCP